ncbi:MAG: hypothetical protein ACYTFG_20970 [Planctomycetota bacterium]|jgi:hypothetical protein
MPAGRPPKGPDLVDRLTGSEEAKRRVKTVLQTISGTLPVKEACAILGVSESRFHQIREEILHNAVTSQEPQPKGRPPDRAAVPGEVLAEVEGLRARNEALEEALKRETVRADLGEIMSSSGSAVLEKKISAEGRQARRKKRKAKRKARKKGRAKSR